MHLLPNALHLTLQARYLHCSGCHFELKQLGFTAAYRARHRLLTSRNTFISILRAGILQAHGSESGTWYNRDLIRRHACADDRPDRIPVHNKYHVANAAHRCGKDRHSMFMFDINLNVQSLVSTVYVRFSSSPTTRSMEIDRILLRCVVTSNVLADTQIFRLIAL
jgi:hypothetical protein